MPASTEPRSGLFHGWALGESGWNAQMDSNLLRIGRAGFHLSVKDRDLATPPGSPATGDTYIIAASPTGAWAGHATEVAIWDGSAWVFYVPRTGWVGYIEDEQKISVFHAGAWTSGRALSGGTANIMAAEVLYNVTLGANGSFDTNDVWPSGLPSGYSRFEIGTQLRSTAAGTSDFGVIYFNGDTTIANYHRQIIEGSGSTIVSNYMDATGFGAVTAAGSQADDFGFNQIWIPGPQSNKAKQYHVFNGVQESATAARASIMAAHWENTAAINRIQIRTDNHPTDLFVAGSQVILIGYRPITVLTQ